MSTRLAYAVLAIALICVSPLSLYGQQTTVLVIAFENQTGDRPLDWIGEGLAASISERLTAQRDLYVFGHEERFASYDRLGIPESVSISRATAIRMAWDMGADILITGRISGTPDEFQIDARLLNLVDDLAGLDVTMNGRLDEVIPMAASLASQLSKELIPSSVLPESDYATRPPVPRSAFEAYVRGITAADPQRRIELLQNAVRLHPQYKAAIFQLGLVHYLDSNYKVSNEFLEKVPANAPEYPQAQFMAAMNAYHLGDYARAAEIFSALPPTYDVLVNRGASLAATGDSAGAMSAWKRAVEQDPSATEAPFNMAYLAFSHGEWELASSRFAQFLQEHARDTEAVFLLGRAYESLGRAEESRRLTGQALRLSPRLSRWLGQPVPNLVRVRTQFNATELRIPGSGLWTEARRFRKAAAQEASNSLTAPRP